MKVKLFNETPDSAMDIDMGIFSPGKDDDVMDADDIEFLMTPVSKGRLPQPVILDEDSGLGGDNVANDNVFLNDDESERMFAIRRPKQLKPTSARNLSNEFHSKRQVPDNGSPFPPAKARRERTPVKRFFSFADAFSKVIDDEDMEEDNLVKTIVNRFENDNDLIADGSSSYCLPTIKGKHSDLKSITPGTLADVLRGDYDDVIGSYRIIDCRYPYEYEGGHVQGAENIYEKENILDLLENRKPVGTDGKRHILVFYCEFSSERGPKMNVVSQWITNLCFIVTMALIYVISGSVLRHGLLARERNNRLDFKLIFQY
ncbi:hypothetical protein KUTeg_005326 [Tegillarca granosa]|uniref:protein-tyrosine-phosphatase n=1 Tax=Tegillarca granosa TaxID=220873 RepID=A0ABQ9FJE5_TEGGR|nr:hypothetical protein KUTeg_005326 [Tegillarca granosa]